MEQRDCYARVWYMKSGEQVGKWKLMMIEDLDYDCEKVVEEDVVVLYDDKRSTYPKNQAFFNLFYARNRIISVRGNCLLVKRDPLTGNFVDMEQCDLDKIRGKQEKSVSLAQEMELSPLSGSGNSFEDLPNAYLVAATEL